MKDKYLLDEFKAILDEWAKDYKQCIDENSIYFPESRSLDDWAIEIATYVDSTDYWNNI